MKSKIKSNVFLFMLFCFLVQCCKTQTQKELVGVVFADFYNNPYYNDTSYTIDTLYVHDLHYSSYDIIKFFRFHLNICDCDYLIAVKYYGFSSKINQIYRLEGFYHNEFTPFFNDNFWLNYKIKPSRNKKRVAKDLWSKVKVDSLDIGEMFLKYYNNLYNCTYDNNSCRNKRYITIYGVKKKRGIFKRKIYYKHYQAGIF